MLRLLVKILTFALIMNFQPGWADVKSDHYRGHYPRRPVPVRPVPVRQWYPYQPVAPYPYYYGGWNNYYWPTTPYWNNQIYYPVFQWQFGGYGSYACIYPPYYCWYR